MIRVAFLLCFFVGCGSTQPSKTDHPSTAEQLGDLVINEISPKPKRGGDWIEIGNRSDQPVDLCGFFITDNIDRLDHYLPLGGPMPPNECTPRLLAPGELLVIVADNKKENDHAPFKLGVVDAVHLLTIKGQAVDSFVYSYPKGETGTFGRSPNLNGPFQPMEPTQGKPNGAPK